MKNDYESVAAIVREKLRELMPANEFVKRSDLILGPEFLSEPLRVFTGSTQYEEFDLEQKEYIKALRKEIRDTPQLTAQERAQKNKQLNTIILFGQLLFSQSASLHFLKELEEKCSKQVHQVGIKEKFLKLRQLIEAEGIKKDSSRLEVLQRRGEFNKLFPEMIKILKRDFKAGTETADLEKIKNFYYQANDLNFKYADKPSRNFSGFVNAYSQIGGQISFAASIMAIGAVALALIPPLTPFMLPIATVAAAIGLVIGTPLALKNLGTMLYNLIRFGASPTPSELLNVALLITTVVLTGIGNYAGPDVLNSEIFQGIKTVDNAGKTVISTIGQVGNLSYQAKIDLYKSQLKAITLPADVTPKSKPSPGSSKH